MSLNSHDVIVRQLQEQLAEFDSELGKTSGKAKKLRGCLNTLAEKLCDGEYGENQLGGPNAMLKLSDTELRDFILNNVYQQKVRFATAIKDLQRTLLDEAREKDNISQMFLATQQENKRLKEAYEQIQIQNEQFQKEVYTKQVEIDELQKEIEKMKKTGGKEKAQNKSVTTNTKKQSENSPTIPPILSSPVLNSEKKVEKKQEKKQEESSPKQSSQSSIIYMDQVPYDVHHQYDKATVYHKMILKLMAESGHNEIKDIIEMCKQEACFGNDTTIRKMIDEMVEGKLLNSETLSTPLRKRFVLYSLSELGRAVYMTDSNRKPVKDEMTRTKEMHATLPHGYCIRDVVTILKDLGYSDVCMDSSKNSTEVPGGKRYIPDITAYFEKTRKTYWEVELGHHHDTDMFDKIEKAAQVTDTLYFVTNDAKACEKVKKQVNALRVKLKREHRTLKLKVYVGTMTMLIKRTPYFDNAETVFQFS